MHRFRRGERVAAYGYRNGKLERFGKGRVTQPSPARVANNTIDTYIKVELDDGHSMYFPEKACKRLIPKPS